MEFEYRVTVIIPVYNVEPYLKDCLDSLVAQTIPQEDMEVLMINDGSTDGSLEICEQYAEAYENFKVLSQENQGVSAARNNGIRSAKGKYLMYLDGDDTLSEETVENVIDFFDEHYDEVDLVAYPRYFCYQDGSIVRHSRDTFIKLSKVYRVEDTPYVSIPTLNVAVKSNVDVLFDTLLDFHEDEAYLTEVIMKSKKFGYVCNAKYLYRKHGNGATDRLVNPYFIFEATMSFYEKMFERFTKNGQTDSYVQATFLNDLGWKIPQDVVFPYHYDPEQLKNAVNRLKRLLNHVDSEFMISHPSIDIYHRFYLLYLRKGDLLDQYYGSNRIALCEKNRLIEVLTFITVVFTKIKISNTFVEWNGFLKSPLFLFLEKPVLYLIIETEDGLFEENLSLLDSAHGYYKSKIKTAKFWRFSFRVPNYLNARITLRAVLNHCDIRIVYYFMPDVMFNTKAVRETFCINGTECTKNKLNFWVKQASLEREGEVAKNRQRWYWKHNKKFWLVRKLTELRSLKKNRIWIYSDSAGVGKDNGYYQFLHDIHQNDGISRYYVIHDKDISQLHLPKGISERQIILFGSKTHKFLYLQCEKIITAYIERYNYIPFDPKTYGNYRDLNDPEIVYLQHGVLHAHQPHKYSLDCLNIDREVVSTTYEIENLTRQYHFRKENLIPAGMSRYDYIDAKRNPSNGDKKILMAPSWRQYLITLKGGGEWHPEHGIFEKSLFYKNVRDFLGSKELARILDEYDYTLDFKLHPIFACYKEHFRFSNPRIHLSETNIDPAEYTVYISDFSSFTFDFVYLKRAILYFFPDYDMFRAGLMSYRELDIPLEDGFGPLTQNVDDAVCELEAILQNGGKADEVYQKRMENFFLFYDNNQCDRIYQALISPPESFHSDETFIDLLKKRT